MSANTYSKLASRRFICIMVAILCTMGLMALGKIEAINFENIMIWLTGIYVVGKPIGDIAGSFVQGIRADKVASPPEMKDV